MTVLNQTVSSRDFNQDIAGAKRAAHDGPVIVTDRGEPAFVLMTYEYFRKMQQGRLTLSDIFSDPRPEANFDFEPERFRDMPRDITLD